MKTKILLADDHDIVRKGLRYLLERNAELKSSAKLLMVDRP